MEVWELWEFEDCGTSCIAFFPASNDSARALLGPSARLTWTVEAESYNAAMAAQHRHLGWEPYVPMVEEPDNASGSVAE